MDISAMVERIRGHRFDGYSPNGIADEIDKFRSGGGVGGIGEAVDAMKAVAAELANTDKTLREELSKLGVAWTSGAGGRASAVLVEQAGFSADAGDKVTQSAELIFAQGEAFTRTLHKLPESSAIRAGSGGYSLGDGLMSLIGYETDHAKAVKESREAKDQAVGVLNDYAKASGDNLSWTEALNAPEALNLAGAPGGPSPLDIGTQAANVHAGGSPIDDCPPTSGGKGSMPTTKSGAAFDPPTPPMGLPAQPQGASRPGVSIPDSSTAPSSATPPSSAPPVVAPGPVVPGGRVPQHTQPNQPGQPGPGQPGQPGPGQPGVPNTPGVIGQNPPTGQGSAKPFPNNFGTPVTPGAPGTTGVPGQSGGIAGKLSGLTGGGGPGADNLVGGKGGPPGGGGGADGPLGKGKIFGSGPQGPGPVPAAGGFTAVPKPGGVGDFASGAAALGAGAVGGAMAGEGDRRGRGVGRSGSPGSFPRTGQVPMGDLPEEEQRALRRSGQGPETEKRRGFLEQAATQDGENDAEHVRKFGIDDKDLFTDQRMVAPDVIGRDDAGDAR
ncbi:hypothetical protein [Amycolatopsis sp. 195334CR]|uniref:hypothetical protein n=1 Tax=Amycolatopsis sp. 195334CR TaxID=2814588 RepID=UPI001A8FA25F|nr:hypothetical protein [Amycolatopsis sp. 195334CR]MBN6035852.1 hypothetical protein [Amycolatopsis sp. 195334CR]